MYRVAFGWSNYRDFQSLSHARRFAAEYDAKTDQPLYKSRLLDLSQRIEGGFREIPKDATQRMES